MRGLALVVQSNANLSVIGLGTVTRNTRRDNTTAPSKDASNIQCSSPTPHHDDVHCSVCSLLTSFETHYCLRLVGMITELDHIFISDESARTLSVVGMDGKAQWLNVKNTHPCVLPGMLSQQRIDTTVLHLLRWWHRFGHPSTPPPKHYHAGTKEHLLCTIDGLEPPPPPPPPVHKVRVKSYLWRHCTMHSFYSKPLKVWTTSQLGTLSNSVLHCSRSSHNDIFSPILLCMGAGSVPATCNSSTKCHKKRRMASYHADQINRTVVSEPRALPAHACP